jgi:hypothetical protein
VTVTINNPQYAGFALQFTGNGFGGNRIDIPLDKPARPVDVGTSDFTLDWWMKIPVGGITAQNCQPGLDGWIQGDILFDRDVYGGGDFGDYGIAVNLSGVAFGVARGNGGNGICGSTNLADNQWHHLAVTRRASDGRLQLYVDGRLDASGSGPAGDVSYRNNRQTSFPQSDPLLVIGAEKHDIIPARFRGIVDEVRISNILRYSGNFSRPTAPFIPDANTVALYHLDEGQGNVINDTSAADGGPSHGSRRSGGTPPGPVWVTDTPFP